MSYNDKHLKVDASQRKLNDKIKNLITDTDGEIFWYIKFNLPLDESSVSSKTMKVTDTDGFIVKTNIIYNKALELIVIEPVDKFEKDEYYILHITKKVKSEDKQNIKRNVHILFKIKEDNLLDVKELEENVKVPTPKVKLSRTLKSKVGLENNDRYQYEKLKEVENTNENKLPFINIKINPFVAIFGAILFFVGALFSIIFLIIIGTVIALAGFIILIIQMVNKTFRSKFLYNLGVVRFNKGNYEKAINNFRKALNQDTRNSLADYAINKCLELMDLT